MQKNKPIIFLGVFFLFTLILFIFSQTTALRTSAQTINQLSDGADAIAVRIVPNPNHYSIYRWYESQGFSGSPQAIIVDGYEAIRDGRTVYVNAANVKDKKIYTNIYLISYNQEPSAKTVDILGQIVKSWKFNSDLIEATNPSPSCSISSLSCLADADCASDRYCATSTIAINSCQLKTIKNCLTDTDCPQNFFCSSVKAKITRDIKRIGKIEELKEALYKYKLANGHYPTMSAGSYLSNHTISVWPSWSQSFLPELAVAQSFVDPINRLGACPGYDMKTCWNKDTKRFVFDPGTDSLTLPAGSQAMVYKTDSQGSKYTIGAVMETREPISDLSFQFEPNNPASSDVVTDTGITSGGKATNTAPYVVDAYLIGEADQEFNGYVKVLDREKNPLTWNLNTTGETWTNWSASPILKNTNNINQKKIFSSRAGAPRTYSAQLTVADGQGETLSTTTNIVIINPKPFIESDNGEYPLSSGNPFSYSFYFSDNNLAIPSSAYTVTKVSGPGNFDLLGFTPTFSQAGTNRYKVTYSGASIPQASIYASTDYTYRISVKDKYNAETTKDFKITLKVESPSLTFDCPLSQRVGSPYSCFLGLTTQGTHKIVYSSSNLPSGINLISNDTSASLSGTGNNTFNQEVTIKATKEYGSFLTKSFNLSINNYCGDNTKQSPNMEGRGGVNNDGYESCDGISGVATDAVTSNINFQYGCATDAISPTPYPIISNNYCVYKPPLTGGGYCGDGYCQLNIQTSNGTVPMEKVCNCSQDCGNCPVGEACNPNGVCQCVPKCDGKDCGSDSCGGFCGTNNGGCASGQICSAGGVCQCIPNCSGKNCGPDGCGGTCGTTSGNCASGQTCNSSGVCVATVVAPVCGDDICDDSETSASCPSDCVGGPVDQCGNGVCDSSETCSSCSIDCSDGSACACLEKDDCLNNWQNCTWNGNVAGCRSR